MEFLKANGIEDNTFVKEMDYQEVLNSQEIFGDELAMFAKKELQKEVNTVYRFAFHSFLPATSLSLSGELAANYSLSLSSSTARKTLSRAPPGELSRWSFASSPSSIAEAKKEFPLLRV